MRTATAITRDRNEWKRVEARLAEEEIRDEAGRGGLDAPENTVEDEGGRWKPLRGEMRVTSNSDG